MYSGERCSALLYVSYNTMYINPWQNLRNSLTYAFHIKNVHGSFLRLAGCNSVLDFSTCHELHVTLEAVYFSDGALLSSVSGRHSLLMQLCSGRQSKELILLIDISYINSLNRPTIFCSISSYQYVTIHCSKHLYFNNLKLNFRVWKGGW